MAGNVLKITALLAVVATGAIGFTLQRTGEMIAVAERFRQAAVTNDADAALACLTRRNRQLDAAAWNSYTTYTRLGEIGALDWTRRAYKGGQGRLTGTAQLEDGGTLLLDLTFKHRNDGWRIDRFAVQLTPDTNPAEEARELFSETRRQLAVAAEQEDVAPLRSRLSERFQREMTEIGLARLVRSMYQETSILETGRLRWSLQTIFDSGKLTLSQGMAGSRGVFSLHVTFAWEGGEWKPDALRVVQPTEEVSLKP